jgi:uncharacterized protein YjbI with pentapeptide repeats
MRKSPGKIRLFSFILVGLTVMLSGCKTPQDLQELGNLAASVLKGEIPGAQSEETKSQSQSQTQSVGREDFSEDFSRLADSSICFLALLGSGDINWSNHPGMFSYITEAKSRGHTPEGCASLQEKRKKEVVDNKTKDPVSVEGNRTRLLITKACPDCKLSAVDLNRSGLREANLEGTDLREANLESADLEGANLKGADLRGANLTSANLRKANLYGAYIQKANLEGANLEYAVLKQADFSGANVKGAKFDADNLALAKQGGAVGVDWSRYNSKISEESKQPIAAKQETNEDKLDLSANLKALKASKACIGCSFKKANLQGENLQGAKLSETDMQGANLSRTNLRGADFQKSDFWQTNLENADLREVNFKGARFMQANLKGANLAGANFQGADLRFVNLEGAFTDGANFQGAKLFGTAIKRPKPRTIKKAEGGDKIFNRLAELLQKNDAEPSSTGKLTDAVKASETKRALNLVSASRSAPDKPNKNVGSQEKELASLPPKDPASNKKSTPKSKSRFSRDNIRPEEGMATAIQSIGTDGTILAGFRGGKLNLLKLSDGKIIRRFDGHKGTIRTITVHPNAKIAASGADDKTIRLWNIGTGAGIGVLKGHTKKVLSLAFSGDGKFLLSGSADGTARVWDVSKQKSTMTYKAHKGEVGAIVTLPGKPIALSASASAKDRSIIRVWNYVNSVPLGNLSGHRAPIFALAVSSDGTKLVSGSKDKTVKIWDIKQRKPIKTLGVLDGHRGAIRSLVIADGGRLIVSGSDDRTIIVWNTKTGEIVDRIKKHKGKIIGLALSLDRKSVISSSKDKSVRVWHLTGGKYAASN